MRNFFFILLLSFMFAFPAGAQNRKSDKENEGLTGPVKSVRIETARLSNKSGNITEEKRLLIRESYFDPSGNLTEEVSRDQSSGLSNKHVYNYDSKGNRKESLYLGGPNRSPVAGRYDDPRVFFSGGGGRNSDGSLPIYWVFKYDDAGNRIEELVKWGPSFLAFRNVYTYDNRGRKKENLRYRGDGELLHKFVYSYDDNEHILEQTEYKGANSLVGKESYNYVFDSHSNWIKRITSRWPIKNGKADSELKEVTYRVISYY